ncbi:NTAN1 amidohydrolase, partial [Polypterus senegalus]
MASTSGERPKRMHKAKYSVDGDSLIITELNSDFSDSDFDAHDLEIEKAKMVNIYDSPGEQIRIGPYSWLSNKDISVWLEQDDQTILKHMSTSPLVEPPHFVTHMKATIQFLLENPRAETLFPGGQSHVYKRSAHGSWDKAADCAVPVHGGNN